MQVPCQSLGLLVGQRELGSSENRPHLGQDVIVGQKPDCAHPAQLEEGGLVSLEEQSADDGVGVKEGL